jgi:TorA maturation chaperone TorD
MHSDEQKLPAQPDNVSGTGSVENAKNERVLLPAEERARAFLYSLLATLLLSPPSADLLHALANADPIAGEAGELESAWEQLVLVAGIMDAEAVREEFDALFVSIGTPLINPHASLYLSGFMMDRPLAALRDTLRELGVVRRTDASELEDHIGSLCETMALLIQHGRPLQMQKAFFDGHIAGWVHACLDNVRNAQDSRFYLNVARVLDAFISVEQEAFEMNTG